MSDWPDRLKAGPIREWPGALTRTRRPAPFRRAGGAPTPLTTTLSQLETELRELSARDVELLVALTPEQFRLDGRPRAGAKPEHPGIILSFAIPGVGAVSYPCDTFTTWEDNLRGVTLALEALRKVDRYGVTKRGEQYRGFLALEATVAPAGFPSAEDALGFIRAMSGERPEQSDREGIARALRLAKRNTHPDTTGGTADAFQKVSIAEAKLREAGLL